MSERSSIYRGITRRKAIEAGVAAGGVLLGGAALAACGSGAGGGGTGTAGGGGATGGVATTNQVTGTPQSGGSLRFGTVGGGPADTVDPNVQLTNLTYYYNYVLYEQLGHVGPDYDIRPQLVEEYESDRGASVWTVRLKQDVEFHNGKTLDAEDVIFSIRRMLDPRAGNPKAGMLSTIDPNGISVLDKRTLRMRLSSPSVVLPESLALWLFILPVGFDPKDPAGTGPFKYVSMTPGREGRFARFENYHGDPAFLDELTIVNYASDVACTNALISNEVDMIDLTTPTVRLAQAHRDIDIFAYETNGYAPFRMNIATAPFSDVRVRQAMRLIADRPQIVDQALSGFGRVANDLYAPQDPAFADDLPQRAQDIEQAKSLLKAAGREQLTLELNVPPDVVSGQVESATVFAEQAKAAGVTVRVKKVESASFYGPNYMNYPFAVEFYNTAGYLVSTQQSDGPTSQGNVTNFRDPEFSKLYFEAIGTTDEAKRAPLLHRMQEIQHEKGGYLLSSFVTLLYASRRVGGMTRNLGVLPPRWALLWKQSPDA